MSTDVMIKGFFAALFSIVFACTVFARYNEKTGSENRASWKQRYLPYVPILILPLFLLFLVVFGLLLLGTDPTAQIMLSTCFSIFPHIALYYAVLLLLLPLLRRRINARACAMLWMIPNFLFLTQLTYMEVPEPLWVIHASGQWVWTLFEIWLTGFVLVLLWKIISHLLFRRRILKKSYPVTDQAVLDLWEQEIKESGLRKPKFQLVISPGMPSPVTVGLFRRATKVVLPERPYSMEELQMIFRHEIIHIGRNDSQSKFFLVFCTAMCWFNPLMWIAMRKSAEDLELSCDETALLGADGEERRQYADLILTTSGEERGFTTCLSAAASTMRYRLKSIVKPGKRSTGALAVGLTFFILCMTCGYTALAYGGSTGEEVLFGNQDHSEFQMRYITLRKDIHMRDYMCTDETAFYEYLGGLEMDHLTGNYSFSENERNFCYILDTPQGTMAVDLFDRIIKIVPLYGERPAALFYYLPEGVDWDYLDTIILAHPTMNVHMTKPEDSEEVDFAAELYRVTTEENGRERVLYEVDPDARTICGFYGFGKYETEFSFSQPLAGPVTVEIERLDSTSTEIISPDESTALFMLPHPACCRVYGDFLGNDGKIYTAEFRFEIGMADATG